MNVIMARYPTWIALPISIVTIFCTNIWQTALHAGVNDTGEKGAKIYCYMRQSGNEHEVSWNAAYEVIKRQSNSLFKTSPKHAAVMITEAVVQDPNNYKNCGGYLGDLFRKSNPVQEKTVDSSESNLKDRYSY